MQQLDGAILVTGGRGFIGSTVVRALLATGAHVRVLDDGSGGTDAYEPPSAVEDIRGDVTDLDAVARAVDGCAAVVHLAAQTSVPRSILQPEVDFHANVIGTFRVLDAARRARVSRVVFASSSAVLDGRRQPLRERLRPSPGSAYGAGKAAAEQYCHAFAASYGMTCVSLRFANCYGPFSWHKSSAVAAFCAAAVRGEPLQIHGDGLQTRDFVHADDIAQAVMAALSRPHRMVAGRVFLIGSGVETTIRELAEQVQTASSLPVTIVHDAPSLGDVRRSVSDIALARRHLGYEPAIDLATGVRGTLRWFEETAAEIGRRFDGMDRSSGSD